MPVTTLPHDHGNSGRAEHLKEILDRTEKFSAAAETISALTGMSSPAVSHHLRILKEAGMLSSRREGREVYYSAADTASARQLHYAAERLLELEGCPVD